MNFSNHRLGKGGAAMKGLILILLFSAVTTARYLKEEL